METVLERQKSVPKCCFGHDLENGSVNRTV